jgi:hypothetical protein
MFDQVARGVHALGSRRRLFGLGVALPLAGLVTSLADEDGEARRQHGRNRGHRPGKRKKNRKGQRGNNGGGKGATPCLGPLTYLQLAINQANAGDTLTLCAGTFPDQTLKIGKNLTIIGAGSGQTTLTKGDLLNSVMTVDQGVTVTLQGLTMSGWGGPGTGLGPAIQNAGTLTLADVVVTQSGEYGAIINGKPGVLHLTAGSSINSNIAQASGAGIQNDGGDVHIETGCSVTQNISTLGDGEDAVGGIYNERGWVFLADTSIVTNNQPTNCGGDRIDKCID